jgi:hypothetical protein
MNRLLVIKSRGALRSPADRLAELDRLCQQPTHRSISLGHRSHLAASPKTARPARISHMAEDGHAGKTMVAACTRPSPMANAAFHRHSLKVRARCVNCARRDPCGGRAAMRVPTAIPRLRTFRHKTIASPRGVRRDACRRRRSRRWQWRQRRPRLRSARIGAESSVSPQRALKAGSSMHQLRGESDGRRRVALPTRDRTIKLGRPDA